MTVSQLNAKLKATEDAHDLTRAARLFNLIRRVKAGNNIGKQGSTKEGFGEQYRIIFTDGGTVDVYVWVIHGINEKNNHEAAEAMCRFKYPNKEIAECVYC